MKLVVAGERTRKPPSPLPSPLLVFPRTSSSTFTLSFHVPSPLSPWIFLQALDRRGRTKGEERLGLVNIVNWKEKHDVFFSLCPVSYLTGKYLTEFYRGLKICVQYFSLLFLIPKEIMEENIYLSLRIS